MTRLVLTAWMTLTGLAAGHGDLHDSIRAVTQRIQQAPAEGNLYLKRALLYAAHEEPAQAHLDFDRAGALGADPRAIAAGRAKLHLATKQFAEAISTLHDLLIHEPGHHEALITRARARANLNDFAGAATDYTAAIAAGPHPEPELYLERAAVLCRTEPPQTEAALRGLNEGLNRLGQGIITLQLAALDIETKTGEFEAALARITAAAGTAPRKEIWLTRRGDVLSRAGRPAEAQQAYQDSLKSIATLPPRARTTRATAELEAHTRRALARLASSGPTRPTPR